MKIIIFFFIFLSFCSCGKNDEQEVNDAIETALIHLTHSECDDAIEVLEKIGRKNKNAIYLKTLSSAYACKAGYSTVKFFGTNLKKISSVQNSFFGSLTKFTTSPMTSPTDSNFVNLQKAIDILLYAGGIDNSSSENRGTIFSAEENQDINIFLVYLTLTQLGKFIFYYGNANPTAGTKGTGSSANGNSNNLTNGCFYNYNPVDATLANTISVARAANILGSCTAAASGHELLTPLPNANTVTRMCQGITLFNNLVDLILNTTIPTNGESLKDLSNTIDDLCSSISGAGSICTVKDQTQCEEDFSASPQTDKLQLYFFSIFETLFL